MNSEKTVDINKQRKRNTLHFKVALVTQILYTLLSGKDGVILSISGLISLLLFHYVMYLCYLKVIRNTKSHGIPALLFIVEIVLLDFYTATTLCTCIPAIIYGIIRARYPYPYIIDSFYLGIVNMVTFVITLLFCIYLKIILKVNNTFMYTLFFIMYSLAALYHFAPENLQQVFLKIIFSPNDTEFNRAAIEYYRPAIKEGVLAFIILDSSNLLTKIKDQFRNNK